MKRLHGSPAVDSEDGDESIEVPEIGPQNGHSGAAHHVPRTMLARIVRARLEEIFEFARARIAASGLDKWAGNRVVISGARARPLTSAGLPAKFSARRSGWPARSPCPVWRKPFRVPNSQPAPAFSSTRRESTQILGPCLRAMTRLGPSPTRSPASASG